MTGAKVATTPDIITVRDDVVTLPTETAICPSPAADYPSWTVQWEEEFNVSSIAELSGRWATAQPWGSAVIVNGESQYYVDNLGVDANSDWTPFLFVQNPTAVKRTDGAYLVIRASPYVDSVTGEAASRSEPVAKHASGILTTRATVQPPVMLEVRAKMPRGRGGFPAIWLLDGRLTGGNQEIDVVEYISQSHTGSDWVTPSLYGSSTWDTIYDAYHDGRGSSVETYTNGNAGETPEWCGLGVDFTREFHTYGLKYT